MSKMPVRRLLRRILPTNIYGVLLTIRDSPARTFQLAMDKCGFVVARKSDYYSPLPSRRRLKSTMARWARPSSLAGIEYDLPEMKTILAELIRSYDQEFMSLPPYEELLQIGFGPGYTHLDARVLYSMLRANKPSRYLEIGSGLSTYYASLAAQRNAAEGYPMEITCIEPYPFEALTTITGIKLIQAEVQDIGLDLFTSLGANDVLFIDSSHAIRLDGDVPFLFLEVLPVLKNGVLIQIHDIPFPYHCPYPPDYWIYKAVWPMWWNESILLHALLCGNNAFEIVLSAPLIRFHDEAFLLRLVPGYQTIEEQPNTFSSIWLRRV